MATSGSPYAPTFPNRPSLHRAPGTRPGQIVAVGGEPEGRALDSRTGLVAVAVRKPDGVVLVDAASGAERASVPLGGAARHLQLAGPGGPVLAPAEENDRLYRIGLPGGEVISETPVGRQPHDAAPAAGQRVFVGDEHHRARGAAHRIPWPRTSARR